MLGHVLRYVFLALLLFLIYHFNAKFSGRKQKFAITFHMASVLFLRKRKKQRNDEEKEEFVHEHTFLWSNVLSGILFICQMFSYVRWYWINTDRKQQNKKKRQTPNVFVLLGYAKKHHAFTRSNIFCSKNHFQLAFCVSCSCFCYCMCSGAFGLHTVWSKHFIYHMSKWSHV